MPLPSLWERVLMEAAYLSLGRTKQRFPALRHAVYGLMVHEEEEETIEP